MILSAVLFFFFLQDTVLPSKSLHLNTASFLIDCEVERQMKNDEETKIEILQRYLLSFFICIFFIFIQLYNHSIFLFVVLMKKTPNLCHFRQTKVLFCKAIHNTARSV